MDKGRRQELDSQKAATETVVLSILRLPIAVGEVGGVGDEGIGRVFDCQLILHPLLA